VVVGEVSTERLGMILAVSMPTFWSSTVLYRWPVEVLTRDLWVLRRILPCRRFVDGFTRGDITLVNWPMIDLGVELDWPRVGGY
jgi:hypothetical protein